MAQYKVPQDVVADDKLLGPFSFRQFVYLMISGGLIALAVGLFQLFPLLAIIPLPPVLFFGALALPLRKDQPMETYLAALVSYYLKPHKRVWEPGQRESTIEITAPKIVEASRTRDITGEEATHRLSFLANLVDTEGYAIKGMSSNPMREDLVAEANATSDMFESNHFNNLESAIVRDENERHAEVVNNMKKAIENDEQMVSSFLAPKVEPKAESVATPIPAPEPVAVAVPPEVVVAAEPAVAPTSPVANLNLPSDKPELNSPVVIMPGEPPAQEMHEVVEKMAEEPEEKPEEKPEEQAPPSRDIMELANNPDFSVATIAKEAKRIKEREEGEVFISLH